MGGDYSHDAAFFAQLAIHEQNDRYPLARCLLAFALGRMGEKETAMQQAALALRDRAQMPADKQDAVCMWGHNALALDQDSLCVHFFRAHEEEEGVHPTCSIKMALALWATGKRSEALPRVQEVLAAEPRNCEAMLCLSLFHRDQGDNKQALQFFEQATSCDPECTTALWLRREAWGPKLRNRVFQLAAWAKAKKGTKPKTPAKQERV